MKIRKDNIDSAQTKNVSNYCEIIQGATYFYIYLASISNYDRMIIDDYMRTGEAEVIVLHERFKRYESEWQQIQIHVINIFDRAAL